MMGDDDPRLAALQAADRRVVAACLNDVEDSRPEARARTRSLFATLERTRASERAHRVGVTGPPGVGKSSLVAAYARGLRGLAPPRSVGILAVDPSSRRSGGALLGDRVRIAAGGDDDAGVFIRSLSSRGELGGLAPAVGAEVIVLSAAYDVVIVETVGVGQSETEVRDVVDTLVFVVQPGAGDTLQHLKAGVMEVPDVFVVSKSDSGSPAERTKRELVSALHTLADAGITTAPPVVLATSAREGTGFAELIAAVDAHGAAGRLSGELGTRRKASSLARAVRLFSRRYGELGVERAGGEEALSRAVASGIDGGEDVDAIVARLNPWPDR